MTTRFERNDVPDICKAEDTIMGIDEAGRGCVFGPMTYGVAFWALSLDEEMKAHNFDDSKAMSAEKRMELFTNLKKETRIGWIVKLISAFEISSKMQRRVPISLNIISHDAAIELVNIALQDGVKVTKVYVDTVGDPGNYQRKLTAAFENRIEFVVEKKADSKYKTVSAASICAKVLRDEVIHNWTWDEPGLKVETDYGSGYPSDPKTVAWMERNIDPVFGFPGSITRFSWQPVKTMLNASKEAADFEWSDDEEEEPAYAQGTSKLTRFFAQSGPSTAKKARTGPLKQRKLTTLEVF